MEKCFPPAPGQCVVLGTGKLDTYTEVLVRVAILLDVTVQPEGTSN